MNGSKTPPKDGYFRRLRRRTISHLFRPVLSTSAGPDKGIAGSAPPLKACNDNQYSEGGDKSAESDEKKYRIGFKVRGYCCAGQTHGCFVHRADDGTERLWCRSRGVWTKETVVCN